VSEACTVQEFVTLCNQIKSPTIVAEKLGVSVRSVFKRMSNLEKVGHRFEVSDKRSVRHIPDTNPARLNKRDIRLRVPKSTRLFVVENRVVFGVFN
jgi:biotin operon repressor